MLQFLGACAYVTELHAREACAQVADALKERSDRIYKKYGSVMLDTDGMTKAISRLPFDQYLLAFTPAFCSHPCMHLAKLL